MGETKVNIEYIKKLRLINEISQQKLAEKLGISIQSYNAKENGKVPFTADDLIKLSKVFNTPIENFFTPGVVKLTIQTA